MLKVRFESFGLNARWLAPPKPMGRVHHHNEVELNYVFRGRVVYLHQWERRVLPAGRLVVFWGAPPHCLIEAEPRTEMAWITVPVSWLLQWGLPAAFMSELMGGRWLMQPPARGEPERYPVRDWVREIEAERGRVPEPLMLELHACFLRLARQSSSPRIETYAPQGATLPGWKHLGVMARYMAEHFQEETQIADVARAAGLHPKYAMALFRRHYGMTIGHYLQRHRIAHAQRLLMTTDLKMIDVALASGFGSLSAFYESFTRATHMAPRTFRLRHARPPEPDAGAPRASGR